MFRNITLTALLGTALTAGLTPATVEAHPPVVRGYGHFEVVVRHGWHWDVYGVYRNRFVAERAAEALRCHGAIANVRGC